MKNQSSSVGGVEGDRRKSNLADKWHHIILEEEKKERQR